MDRIFLLFLIIYLFSVNCGFSQNQVDEEKKVYKADNGTLYIQKTLPVYLKISTSDNSDSEKFFLRSKKTPQYANPMYFDADGFNSIRTQGIVDKSGNVIDAENDIIFEVYGDSKPPESYKIIQSKYFKYNEGKRVYKDSVVIDILGYDMFSGVGNMYYSINNSSFSLYKEQLTVKTKGMIEFQYYSVDNVGNIEEVKKIEFFIEKGQ